MLTVSQITRQRERRAREHHHYLPHLSFGAAVVISLAAALFSFAIIGLYLDLARSLPSLEALPALLDKNNGQLWQPTRLYDRNGQQVILTLENPASAGWRYLTLDEFAPPLITTTLGLADPGFWSHPGFSLADIGQGVHPTLAQRLASDLLLWDEPASLRRDLRERLLAAQITARFGRKQVLEWYLNNTQFGHWLYGADAAAHAYLDKSAASLTLAEAALLSAAAQMPEIDPLTAPELILERQKQILQMLQRQGLVSSEQAVQASQQTLQLRPPPVANLLAPFFTDLVLEQLAGQFPRTRIERGGLRVITTLDVDLQQQTACAVAAQLARLQGVPGDPACDAARLLPTLTLPDANFQHLAATAVILDPRNGQVMALVGDSLTSLDPAHLPGRSAGSLYTPFIYLSAFARGLGPATLAWDLPNTLPGVSNLDKQSHGPLRLRTALANDYLVPAAQLFEQIGGENVWRTARLFGVMQRNTSPGLDAFLENETILLEAAHSLGVFANQGVLAGRILAESAGLSPVAVLRMESLDGRVWLDWTEPQRRPVVSVPLSYLVVHTLSDEAARWPSLGHPNPLEIGRPAAVKLGQTLEGDDLWTVGATPQRIVGVWLGRTEAERGERLPVNIAAALWHAIIQYASRELPAQNWKMPTGITQKTICDPSGLLPTVECATLADEIFMAGSEPTQLDPFYRTVPVNRETGHLATVFTPPELVEERVYLILPSQASEWARQAGLPIPPNEYDVIPAGQPASPGVYISAPEMFVQVAGQVTFRGSAGGEKFSFYRLQVGAGLNPQRWIQIGQDVTTPVKDGVLGVWDTTGLSGLYAVQLLAVTEDQRVVTAVTQVTVDNQAPQIAILIPSDGQKVVLPPEKVIVLQADASDDVLLYQVQFLVDGQPVGVFFEPPFLLAWPASLGSHRLKVLATDQAGNVTQAEVDFEVAP